MDNCFNMEYVIHTGGKSLFNLDCNKIPYLKVNLQPLSASTSKIPQETSSPVDAEGKRGGGVQIPLCRGTSCSLAGTCLDTKQRILDHPVQSESSEDQVTGTFLAGLEDAICCSGELSEAVGRGQAVLGGFTVKSCGNTFTAQLKHHFLLGACPDPST